MNLPPKVLRVIAEDKREYRHWHLPDIAALVKGFPGSGVKRVQELLRQGDRPYRSSEVIRQKACELGIKCGTFNPKALAVLVLLSSSCITSAATTNEILAAIQRVETGGHRNPSQAVGDGVKVCKSIRLWYNKTSPRGCCYHPGSPNHTPAYSGGERHDCNQATRTHKEMQELRSGVQAQEQNNDVLLKEMHWPSPANQVPEEVLPLLRKGNRKASNAGRAPSTNIDLRADQMLQLPLQCSVQNWEADKGCGYVFGIKPASPETRGLMLRGVRSHKRKNRGSPQGPGQVKQLSVKSDDLVPPLSQQGTLGRQLESQKTVTNLHNMRQAVQEQGVVCDALCEVVQVRRSAPVPNAQQEEQRRFLDAISHVESGGKDVTADNGRSIGPMCIQRAYWQDSRVPGRYEQVRNDAYARQVVIAYAKRYEPEALRRGDWETLARLHNAGPGWRKKMRATDGYWRRVKGAMR